MLGSIFKRCRCDFSLCRYPKTIHAERHAPARTKKSPPRGPETFLSSLLKAVAASAVLHVAGIADVDGLELAVAAVHIELTLRNAARDAAVDHIAIHIPPPYPLNMRKNKKNYQKPR